MATILLVLTSLLAIVAWVLFLRTRFPALRYRATQLFLGSTPSTPQQPEPAESSPAPSSPLFTHIRHPYVPRNVNHVHAAERQSFNQRLAVIITRGFGTMWAFYALVAWMLVWMTLATVGIWVFRNDRYPFPFLLFCSNLIQLWALPVLAVGQAVLGRKAELQADETYQSTLRILHDSEQIMHHLAAQDVEAVAQRELLKSIQTYLQSLQIPPSVSVSGVADANSTSAPTAMIIADPTLPLARSTTTRKRRRRVAAAQT